MKENDKSERSAMAYRPEEKSQAIILLMTNNYDFEKVSEQTGIPEITLRRWGNDQMALEIDKNDTKKFPIPNMLEEAIKKLLELMPEEWSGQAWGVTFGILIDKWLLMQGESTSRQETILRGIKDISPNERDNVLLQAEAILREAGIKSENSSSIIDSEPDTDELEGLA